MLARLDVNPGQSVRRCASLVNSAIVDQLEISEREGHALEAPEGLP
jgi:hypothetical protein